MKGAVGIGVMRLGVFGLACVLAACGVVASARADACRLSRPDLKRDLVQGCSIHHLQARIDRVHPQFLGRVHSDELSCGLLKLGAWRQALQLAVDDCRNASFPTTRDYGSKLVISGRHGPYRSIDTYSGDVWMRRTYNTRTGRVLTLKEVIPGDWTHVMTFVEQRLRAIPAEEQRQFDPLSFALQDGADGLTVIYALQDPREPMAKTVRIVLPARVH